MERTMWTDGRLDEKFNAIDKRFDAVDQRFDGLEHRMEVGFERVDREIRDLRLVMFQIGGAMMVGLVGVIATVLASSG
jgi:hypothetical protein